MIKILALIRKLLSLLCTDTNTTPFNTKFSWGKTTWLGKTGIENTVQNFLRGNFYRGRSPSAPRNRRSPPQKLPNQHQI